jgi:outer membrane scaffolding protein for murein synthesis (MipA/OmpV family)
MKLLFAIALGAACGAASAQTPAVNRMPDGSRDLYLGLGAQSAPRYEGAREQRVSLLPVLQLEASNGMFVSGLSAGMHLSSAPALEYGPLLALQPRRSASGNADGVGGVDSASRQGLMLVQQPPPDAAARTLPVASRLYGMDTIGARLQVGGFITLYLTPHLRLTNELLYGSGNEKKGATWSVAVQHIGADAALHHSVSLSAGLTVANRDYQQAFFGVAPDEAARSGYRAYAAGGGLKDVHLGARWNWALAPSWIVTSGLRASRLLGSAKDSPLVERPTNLTVSTALAYRF